jgi:uncharacterized repeat protein (TIGR03803 family)
MEEGLPVPKIGWQAVALCMLACAGTTPAEAREFTTLHNFTGTADGANPQWGALLLGGSLYGVTYNGGSVGGGGTGCGTVFRIDAHTGAETAVHVFACNNGLDGSYPDSNLVYYRGRLYGATNAGGLGSLNYGTVFSVEPATVAESVVYSFPGPAGGYIYPYEGVTLRQGVLYGGAAYAQPGEWNVGAVFGVDLATGQGTGGVAIQCLVGEGYVSGPVSFVGKSVFGAGGNGFDPDCSRETLFNGVVFKVSQGNPAALYYFGGVTAHDGNGPVGNVVVLPHAIYGVTRAGGSSKCNGGCGTVYMVNSDTGVETIMHRFFGGADGAAPLGGLTLMDGVLYGTTVADGADGAGTIFAVTPATGAFEKLYDFVGSTDGAGGGPLYAANGVLYGTANSGGANGDGTVFRFRP